MSRGHIAATHNRSFYADPQNCGICRGALEERRLEQQKADSIAKQHRLSAEAAKLSERERASQKAAADASASTARVAAERARRRERMTRSRRLLDTLLHGASAGVGCFVVLLILSIVFGIAVFAIQVLYGIFN